MEQGKQKKHDKAIKSEIPVYYAEVFNKVDEKVEGLDMLDKIVLLSDHLHSLTAAREKITELTNMIFEKREVIQGRDHDIHVLESIISELRQEIERLSKHEIQ